MTDRLYIIRLTVLITSTTYLEARSLFVVFGTNSFQEGENHQLLWRRKPYRFRNQVAIAGARKQGARQQI